jgi:AcrR family transcriptional regulator
MMRVSHDDPRSRLLDAAERLFGQHGLQSSIRHITAAAGANLAAVNYHFRTKERLIAEVLGRRAEPINRERVRLLEMCEAESNGEPVAVEKILDALVRPAIELMEERPEFLRFAGRLFSDPDPQMREVLRERFGPTARRFLDALSRSLPGVERTELAARFGFFTGSMLFAWTKQLELTRIFGNGPPDGGAEALMTMLVRYGAAGMRAGVQGGGT